MEVLTPSFCLLPSLSAIKKQVARLSWAASHFQTWVAGFHMALDLGNCTSFPLAVGLPSLHSSHFSALANAHRPSACCIKFDVPALSPSAAIFPHGEDFHPHSEWGGEGERGAGSLDGGRSRRGFSQCRFHAEKWGICHHLRVDSDNGTATATMGISPGMERKRSTANEGGRKGRGAGSRLGKRNGCKWRTNPKRKLSCHAMPATP